MLVFYYFLLSSFLFYVIVLLYIVIFDFYFLYYLLPMFSCDLCYFLFGVSVFIPSCVFCNFSEFWIQDICVMARWPLSIGKYGRYRCCFRPRESFATFPLSTHSCCLRFLYTKCRFPYRISLWCAYV